MVCGSEKLKRALATLVLLALLAGASCVRREEPQPDPPVSESGGTLVIAAGVEVRWESPDGEWLESETGKPCTLRMDAPMYVVDSASLFSLLLRDRLEAGRTDWYLLIPDAEGAESLARAATFGQLSAQESLLCFRGASFADDVPVLVRKGDGEERYWLCSVRYRRLESVDTAEALRFARDFVSAMPEGLDDAGKVLWIHDTLLESVEFDHEAQSLSAALAAENGAWLADGYDPASGKLTYSSREWRVLDASSAWNLFYLGRGLCHAYSSAFKMIADAAGIPAVIVRGLGMGQGHAWNLVKTDGLWMQIDLTFDDNYDGIIHEYFLVPLSVEFPDHAYDIPIESYLDTADRAYP